MRLIDADALNNRFEKVKKECESLSDIVQIIGVQSVIDTQPTAYDVDKIAEQLKDAKQDIALIYPTDQGYDYDEADGVEINKAIEIVRAGIMGGD